jgi:hypothetical protein
MLGLQVSDKFTVRYIGVTIARFIAAGMRLQGGGRSESIRSLRRARCGSKPICCRHVNAEQDSTAPLLLSSAVSIAASYVLLRWTQRHTPDPTIARRVPVHELSGAGKIAAAGIAATTIVLLSAYATDVQLGQASETAAGANLQCQNEFPGTLPVGQRRFETFRGSS